MIHINLLPQTMRWQEKSRDTGPVAALGNKLIFFGVGATLGLVIFLFLAFVVFPSALAHLRLAHWQGRWNAMASQFKEVDAFSETQRECGARLAELARKRKDGVRWAKVLNALSDVVPPSIRLTRITSGPMAEMVPISPGPGTPASTPSASPQTVRKFFDVMELDGIAEKGVLGEEDMNGLLEQMRADQTISEYFERIELVGVATLPDQTKKFSFRCRFKEKKPWKPSPG